MQDDPCKSSGRFCEGVGKGNEGVCVERLIIVTQARKLRTKVFLLRGPTPFEDMIFYLWTDSNEICTAYVKLNSKHILFMRIF